MIDDHQHSDYATPSNITCIDCGEKMDMCAYCNEPVHECVRVAKKSPLLPGYREVPGFPDFMVNKQATVRHIRTQRYCFLLRVSKTGGAMINVVNNGKKYMRAAQDLRDLAFPNE